MQRVSATAASPAEASEMPQQRDHGHALLAESNNTSWFTMFRKIA
jgi:hypothetical protein